MLKVAEIHTPKLRKEMGTKEYRQLARKRAGIEGISSAVRRKKKIPNWSIAGQGTDALKNMVWIKN